MSKQRIAVQDAWLDDYRAVAEIALQSAPQQLESLQFGAIP